MTRTQLRLGSAVLVSLICGGNALAQESTCMAGNYVVTNCGRMPLDSVITYMAPVDAQRHVVCAEGKNAVVEAANDGVLFWWFDDAQNTFPGVKLWGKWDRHTNSIFVRREAIHEPSSSEHYLPFLLTHEAWHRKGFNESASDRQVRRMMDYLCVSGISF